MRWPRWKISTVLARVAHVDLFARVAVRHRVIVLIKLDVIVRPDTRDLPLRVLIGLLGQRPECRTIDFVEDATAGAGQFLEGPVVQIAQQRGDRPVGLVQAEEALVAQAGEDPSLHQEDRQLCFRLVPRFFTASRDHSHGVMPGHFLVGWIDVRIVEPRLVDARFQIVGHQDLD